MGRPPTTLEDLQSELNRESQEGGTGDDFRGSEALLSRTLSSLGLDDTLTFTRTLSTRAMPGMDVELRPGGAEQIVTGEREREAQVMMMNVYHRRPPMAQRITDAAAAADPLLIR
jgi:hypothetical protein